MKDQLVARKRGIGWKILLVVIIVLVIGYLVPFVFLRDDPAIATDLRDGLKLEAVVDQEAPLLGLLIIHRRVQKVQDDNFLVYGTTLFGIPIVRTLLMDCAKDVNFSVARCDQGWNDWTIPPSDPTIDSFEVCAAFGYPVRESYPAQCSTPDGRVFAQDIGNELEVADQIVIETPRPGATIESPVAISGRARGTWFFEASFPVRLVDNNNKEIATGVATAQDDWMTEKFVPFTASLTFSDPSAGSGTLILEKDNPSGLPQNDAALEVPLKW